jgi:hypothetical protein
MGRLVDISCLIRQALALCAFNRNSLSLHVVDAKLGAGILPEIELGQIPIKMFRTYLKIADRARSAINVG